VGSGEFSFTITEPGADRLPSWLDGSPGGGGGEYRVNVRGELVRCGWGDPSDPDNGIKDELINHTPFWLECVWGKEEEEDALTINVEEQWRFIDSNGKFRPALFDTSATADANTMIRNAKSSGLIIKKRTSPVLLDNYIYHCQIKSAEAGRAVTLDQLGWDNARSSFVVGSLRYKGGRMADRVRLSGGARTITKQFGIRAKGDWKEQLEVLRMYGRDGVSPVARGLMLFGLCTPLLTFMQESSFLVLLTGISGNGKSSMQRVINGFWGEPRESHLGITDTVKGQMGRIAALHNLPVTFDEITLKDGNEEAGEMRDFALKLTSDVSQAAKEQDGTLRQTTETWDTIVIASSNVTLEEFIGGGRDKDEAGRKRVIELVLGERSVPRNPEWLALLAEMADRRDSNYGWLGPMFTDYFITHKDRFLGRLRANLIACKSLNTDNWSERYRETAHALLLTTGEIVEEMGWVAGTSWADGTFPESRNNKANRANQPVVVAGTDVESMPDWLRFDAFVAAMRMALDGNLLKSHNGHAAVTSFSSRPIFGVVLTASKDGVSPSHDRTQIVISKDAFHRYCDSRQTDPKFVLPRWQAQGHRIREGQYPELHQDTRFEQGLCPDMYFFVVKDDMV
jgi:hypothetical protein